MSPTRLVQLASKREDWTNASKAWEKAQRGVTVCRECFKLDRGAFPRPLDVPLSSMYRYASYTSVAFISVGIIHVRLFDLLQPHLPEFSLGECTWKNGSPMPDYHSIYFRRSIMPRSSCKSRNYNHYQCPTCGIIASSSDRTYVLGPELPDGEVFQDAISSLYVTQSLASRLPLEQFPDLESVYYPVLDEVVEGDMVPPGYQPCGRGIGLQNGVPPPAREWPPVSPDPRHDELRSLHPDLPRLDEDRAASCPVPMREVLRYLRLELGASCPKPGDLEFVRTARLRSDDCWLWRFEEQPIHDSYVTVWRDANGNCQIGYRSNPDGLSPEQYVYAEFHRML